MFDDEIKDGRLRLMLACCHTLLPPEAQAALALKTLCRVQRRQSRNAIPDDGGSDCQAADTRQAKLRELRIPFEIPSGEELSIRLDGVRLINALGGRGEEEQRDVPANSVVN